MNDTLAPARFDQFVETRNRQVLVDADSCSIVKDLKAIDSTLGVRFVDGPEPFFAIYQDIEHPDGRREQHLVTTAQAYPTSFGTYTGLDARVVERVRQITSPDYDFMKEAEQIKRDYDEAKRRERADAFGDAAEQAAHAIRKDLGIKTKAFIK
ncbi:MAG: hypothetical protein EBS90_12990 [Betaproteobacteria bacterium]|nr:hypothetical protein [Betaproteobacteria bacterium]